MRWCVCGALHCLVFNARSVRDMYARVGLVGCTGVSLHGTALVLDWLLRTGLVYCCTLLAGFSANLFHGKLGTFLGSTLHWSCSWRAGQ